MIDEKRAINVIGILIPFTLSAYTILSISMVLKELALAFDSPISVVSLVFPIDFIGGAIGGVVVGRLADRFGRKMLTVISVIIFSASAIIASFSRSLIDIYIAWFFVGFGVNAENGVAYPLIVESLSSQTGLFGGLVQGLYYVAFGIDSLTYVFIHSWKSIFLFVGVLSLVLGLPSSLAIKETLKPKEGKSDIRSIFKGGYAKKTLLLSIIITASFMLVVPLLSIAPAALGSTNKSWLVTIMSIVGFASFLSSGYASDILGRKKTTIILSLIGLVGGLLLALLHYAEINLIASMLLLYISSGLFAYEGVWVSENYSEDVRASASNIVFLFGRLIGGFSPSIAILIGTRSIINGIGLLSFLSSLIIIFSSLCLKEADKLPAYLSI